MKLARRIAAFTATLALAAVVCPAQSLSPKWEDLTSGDFVKALQQSGGVCLMPMGSIEKFGPSGPLGTNLYLARLVALEAVKQEYAVVFPEYFSSVTTTNSALPGTIAYSPKLQLEMLEETTSEMARNGCKKILLVNGHSGNTTLINFFMVNLMQTPHDYAVYSIYGPEFPIGGPTLAKLPPAGQPSKPGADGHGGEERISAMLAYYPDLVHLDRAHSEPALPGHGLEPPSQHVATGFMADLTTGYSGDASGATATRGKVLVQYTVDRLIKVIKDVKADTKTLGVEREFSDQREKPANQK